MWQFVTEGRQGVKFGRPHKNDAINDTSDSLIYNKCSKIALDHEWWLMAFSETFSFCLHASQEVTAATNLQILQFLVLSSRFSINGVSYIAANLVIWNFMSAVHFITGKYWSIHLQHAFTTGLYLHQVWAAECWHSAKKCTNFVNVRLQ